MNGDLGGIPSWVEDRLGVRFDGHQATRMRTAIMRRAVAEGCPSPAAYLDLLTNDAVAANALVDALVIQETYFLRDHRQMALLADHVLPDVAQRAGSRPIDVWSAGCATGEEAYTVAMLATEATPTIPVRVLGTDVSTSAIEHAGRGVYGPWSLRAVDDLRRRAWFDHHDGTYGVRDPLRRAVRFQVANLLDPMPAQFDVVVCRNVLLYLTGDAIARVGAQLAASLRRDGWLVIGASDPPLELDGLERTRTPAGLAYRRVVPRRRAAPASRPSPPRPRRSERSSATVAPPLDAGTVVDPMEAAMRALSEDPLDAEHHYVAAILHLDAGRADEAADEARSALFLDPDRADARLLLGLAEAARGNADAAARHYRAAARAGDAAYVAAVAEQLTQRTGHGRAS